MNRNNTLEIGNDYSENSDLDSSASVEDFIRELEAKEKDLHITAELQIEVSKSEFDDTNLPDFIVEEFRAPLEKSIERKPIATAVSQSALKTEIAELESAICSFKAERIEILERSRRQTDDFENYRRRMERDRHETLSAQMMNLAVKMLPVLDNLDRALDFASAMTPETRGKIEEFVTGIELVNHQVHDVLAAMGVKPIIAVGEEFDPHLHEAVATETADSFPPNTVLNELLKGYRMGSRVIRHSMVKVTAPVSIQDDAEQ